MDAVQQTRPDPVISLLECGDLEAEFAPTLHQEGETGEK